MPYGAPAPALVGTDHEYRNFNLGFGDLAPDRAHRTEPPDGLDMQPEPVVVIDREIQRTGFAVKDDAFGSEATGTGSRPALIRGRLNSVSGLC